MNRETTGPVLTFDRASFVIGSTRLLDEVVLSLAAGERVAIVGESGIGKSALLRLATGLAAPLAGRVALFGENLAQATPTVRRLLRSRCGIAFQGSSLIGGLTVEDNLWLGLAASATARQRLQARLDRIALAFGIEHAGSLFVDALSAGERRRVELARAFVRDPALVLLDEPLEGARADSARLEATLHRLIVPRGRALLLATQDEALAGRLCERVFRLGSGRLVQQSATSVGSEP